MIGTAAAAAAGMIETSGLPQGVATTRRIWSAFVGDTWRDDGFAHGALEYEEHRLEVQPSVFLEVQPPVVVFRHVSTGMVSNKLYARSYATESKAIAAVIETLLSRREMLTAHVELLRDRLRSIISSDAAAEIEVVK
jgi:hypothetical protein